MARYTAATTKVTPLFLDLDRTARHEHRFYWTVDVIQSQSIGQVREDTLPQFPWLRCKSPRAEFPKLRRPKWVIFWVVAYVC